MNSILVPPGWANKKEKPNFIEIVSPNGRQRMLHPIYDCYSDVGPFAIFMSIHLAFFRVIGFRAYLSRADGCYIILWEISKDNNNYPLTSIELSLEDTRLPAIEFVKKFIDLLPFDMEEFT